NWLIKKIINCELIPGQFIMSENQISTKFQCSRITARESLKKLVSIGVIDVIATKGYKVSDSNVFVQLAKLEELNLNNIIVLENGKKLQNLNNIKIKFFENILIKYEKYILFSSEKKLNLGKNKNKESFIFDELTFLNCPPISIVYKKKKEKRIKFLEMKV
ncbi:MAG: winged helix-turn-helix domain-containing protein, partial [Mollicutes bacterium PWAP]|nr:winged helix-turn-helix domain-containing protein [Mollicutes bacterium PWAP]